MQSDFSLSMKRKGVLFNHSRGQSSWQMDKGAVPSPRVLKAIDDAKEYFFKALDEAWIADEKEAALDAATKRSEAAEGELARLAPYLRDVKPGTVNENGWVPGRSQSTDKGEADGR